MKGERLMRRKTDDYTLSRGATGDNILHAEVERLRRPLCIANIREGKRLAGDDTKLPTPEKLI